MGVLELFQVVLDRPHKIYHVGEVVRGAVALTLTQPIQITSVEVKLLGWATVKWHSGSGKNRKEHKEAELYCNDTIVLQGPGDSSSVLLGVGQYGFQFEFLLRSNIPGSFEGQYGAVRYLVSAVIKRPSNVDDHSVMVPIKVPAWLNLNEEPEQLRIPVTLAESEKVTGCCSCINSGSVEVDIEINRSCFLPGQTLRIRGVVRNKSSSTIGPAYAHIIKVTRYETSITRGSAETFNSVVVVASETLDAGEVDPWDVPLVIPALQPSRNDYCGLITLLYFFEFRVELPHDRTLQILKHIMVGTIPYEGMSDASAVISSQPSQPALTSS